MDGINYMAGLFDVYHKEFDQWYEKNKYAYFSEIEAVKKVIPKGTGLEIGVGTGRFASPLGVAFGIDPSVDMVKIAKARGVNARVGLGEHLPFSNDKFDYVLIIVTLCFVRDPEMVIKEASRVLKTPGRIIIGIVDKDSFLGKIYRSKNSKFYRAARFFSVAEVIELLERNDFTNFCFYQCIFKPLENINELEMPAIGYGRGGFVVIAADKKSV